MVRASNKMALTVMTGLMLTVPILVKAGHQDWITIRQEAFELIEKQTDQVAALLRKRETDWQAVLEVSEQLAENSAMLKDAFPPESQAGSKAKDSVWTKPEKFHSLMHDFGEGYATLLSASKEQNLSLAEQGLNQAEKTCRACHRSYRSRW
ncbi:putative Cytochrome c556 [Vibrio nigripulchritudo SOn1]|uniref:Cytochrome c556 n=2 Tax=Vibrio TaxID=662 RepID=A0AAV2VUA5_9VIBR|nr:cytochrome c [Vibrio nigripulchritudo]CCO48043.1 putative Cytochrome c556 [Vibrio nigripulchritudo SOn1]